MDRLKSILNTYYKIALSLAVVFIFLRIYEYFAAGVKFNLSLPSPLIVILCFYSDLITWFVYATILIVPFSLVHLLNRKLACIFVHIINVLIIIGLFGLIYVFSERSIPFDHELFVRKPSETWSTISEVIYGRSGSMWPILLIIASYFVLCKFILDKISFKPILLYSFFFASLIIFVFQSKLSPSFKQFKSINDYYYISNKLLFFKSDVYNWLVYSRKVDLKLYSQKEVLNEIEFFQRQSDFNFVDKNYPLLHIDETKDVLGNFFRHSDTLPNIVIIIAEGLSRDFSGYDAEAGSFTPFLDSLAEHSLHWQNCLSSADATFASAPSILGSLPFGNHGFTQLEKSIEYLSLIKILKVNGYSSFYFAGGEMNYDNFACFMLDQGTDYLSMWYGPKYERMGRGAEGWSAGYPDHAIFDRGFEILDEHQKTPYIATYLTLTTHSPFIFKEQARYEKYLETILRQRKIPNAKREKLLHYKPMLSTVLYGDDCLRDFFAKYRKRPEFKNTIFIITGDHHHGFYPVRNVIDDYNVPLIVYSPMLYKGVRFESVNAHINIAPTILAFLKNSYQLPNTPVYVHWLGNQLDTCKTFRCIHDVPFMLSNRNMDNYLSGNYYFAYNSLYKLLPGLNLQGIDDENLYKLYKKKIENFRFINTYICENNLLYPKGRDMFSGQSTELFSFSDAVEQNLSGKVNGIKKVSSYSLPSNYKKLRVLISFETQIDTQYFSKLPRMVTRILNEDKDTLYWQVKSMNDYILRPTRNMTWVNYLENDIYDMTTYPADKENSFHIEFENRNEIPFKIRKLKIQFIGIN
jgi:phosphoglycerol transferase MdoB-like AlkP superfamily enzyme